VLPKETIRLLDAEGKLIRELPGGGDALRFLPDGKTLAAVAITHGAYKRINDPNGKGYHRVDVAHGRLHLWDVTTGKLLSPWRDPKTKKPVSQLSLSEFCYGLAFSPDGKTLAVQEWEGTTRLWDVLKGQTDRKFSVKGRGPLFSPDGQTLVARTVWGNNGYVKQKLTTYCYDVATGKEHLKIDGVGHVVAISPDGKTLAALDEDDIKKIHLIEAHTGKKRGHFTGHAARVRALAFSADGERLASGSEDTTVLVWDVAGQAEAGQAPRAPAEGQAGAKPGEAALKHTLKGHKEKVAAVAFDLNGKTVASGGDDGKVVLWEAATGTKLAELSRGRSEDTEVSSLVFAPFGTYGKSLIVGRWDGTLQYWNIFDSGDRRGVERETWRGRGAVLSVAYCKVGNLVATGDHEKLVKLYHGPAPVSFAGHTDKVYSVAIAPDGKTLFSGSADKSVIVWDVATRKRRAVLDRHTGAVRLVACAADGKTLATASADGTVRLWDVGGQPPKELAVLKGHKGEVFAVAFAPDGKTLASAGADGSVRLWDLKQAEPRERRVLRGHEGAVLAVAFSPDGRALATGGGDATVRLWDAAGEK
jgi:WD40 repeat protein